MMVMKQHSVQAAFLRRVKHFVGDSRVQLATGLILIVTGVVEIFESAFVEMFGWSVGAHHGVIVFGIVQVLYALTEILEGFENIEIAELSEEVERIEESEDGSV
jgi:peptidoglycan biosynthesis protein MviN/MurJ (putative lipid II flippase)